MIFVPMIIYEKYIEIFTKIYQDKKSILEEKKDNLTKMYSKFN
jgi:hypothetical protein